MIRPALGFIVAGFAAWEGGSSAALDASAPKAPEAGALMETFALPPAMPLRACSFRKPVCVNAAAAKGALALHVLGAIERSWITMVDTLRVPAPDPSPGSATFETWILPGQTESVRARVAGRDVLSAWDRARGFLVVDDAERPRCALDARIAREVARASLFRAAPATSNALALAATESLVQSFSPCGIETTEGLEAWQAHPERALFDEWTEGGKPLPSRHAEAASLFFTWLDERLGQQVAALVPGLWSLAATATPWGASRWASEPDLFDVLKESSKDRLFATSTLDDLLLEFAVARAAPRWPGASPVRERLALEKAWTLDWPSAPRRLKSAVGVSPTGATYIEVRHAGATPGARLRVELAWEEHATFKWALVRLDANGAPQSRVAIPSMPRATEANFTLVDLDQTASILLVGVALGDPQHTFDPDEPELEPHGYMVTFGAQ